MCVHVCMIIPSYRIIHLHPFHRYICIRVALLDFWKANMSGTLCIWYQQRYRPHPLAVRNTHTVHTVSGTAYNSRSTLTMDSTSGLMSTPIPIEPTHMPHDINLLHDSLNFKAHSNSFKANTCYWEHDRGMSSTMLVH